MRGKAILIAAALVLVLGGAGAAAWVATNDEGDSASAFLGDAPGVDEPPQTTQTAPPATPPETNLSPTPSATDTELQPAPTTTEPEPPADRPPAGPRRKTHFKRERKNAAKDDQPQRKFTVPPAHEFSGEGNASLGTVDVKATSVLKWRTSKGRFEVHFGREDFPIIAPTKSGQLILPPFRFERVRVIAAGRWRITVTPQ